MVQWLIDPEHAPTGPAEGEHRADSPGGAPARSPAPGRFGAQLRLEVCGTLWTTRPTRARHADSTRHLPPALDGTGDEEHPVHAEACADGGLRDPGHPVLLVALAAVCCSLPLVIERCLAWAPRGGLPSTVHNRRHNGFATVIVICSWHDRR